MKQTLVLLSALCLFSSAMAAEETVKVQCPLGTTVTKLTLGVPVSYKVTVYASSGVKSVKWAGLPSGLKYNAKTGNIEGAASKAGSFKPKLSFSTKAGNKYTSSPNTITVPKFEDSLVGTFKGAFDFYSGGAYESGGLVTMKIAASGKCTGSYTQYYPKKKSFAIASGNFTHPQRSNSYFQLKLKNGRTLNLEYGTAPFSNKYVGYFMERSSYSSSYQADIVQDPFARSDTKAIAKSLVGRKQVLKYKDAEYDYTLTISSSGKVTVKGVYSGGFKISCSNGFLMPALDSTRSTYYFYVAAPWPAATDYWWDYLKCTSSGVWSWWE